MAGRKGKRVALLVLAAGVAVLGVAVYAGRDLLIEEWYLYRLRSEDEAVRREAVEHLGDLRSARAVPRLIALAVEEAEVHRTTDPSREGFQDIQATLIKIGSRGITGLVGAFQSSEPAARSFALSTLRGLGPEAEGAAPALVADLALATSGWNETRSIEATLVSIGRGALRALLDTFQQFDHIASFLARRTTALKIDPTADTAIAERAVPSLLGALDEDGVERRTDALRALGTLGPAAAKAVPRLLDVLEKDDAPTKFEAASALGKIGAPAAPGLFDLLRRTDQDPTLIFVALIEIQQKHGGVLAPSIQGLEDANPRFAANCASLIAALGTSGVDASAAIPALLAARGSGSSLLRKAVQETLRSLGR